MKKEKTGYPENFHSFQFPAKIDQYHQILWVETQPQVNRANH